MPSGLERLLGLECYATRSPGIGGRLRSTPQDFVVEEIPRPPSPAQGAGKYTIATLRATNWETNRLVREIGRRLGVSRRAIYFTGTKDKRAVKTQQMAIQAPEAAVRALRIPDLEVLSTFRADRAPKLGDLVGNRFDVVVRDPEPGTEEALRRCAAVDEDLGHAGGMPNFFGPQRFGTLRPVTQRVGERILRGDFEGAVMVYVAEPQTGEPEESFEARRTLAEERDFVKARTYYPRRLSFERVLIEHLAHQPGDWIGALRRLPLNMVTMFVYAHQSLLFNRMLSQRLRLDASLRTLHPGDLVVPVDPDGWPELDTVIPVTPGNLEKCQGQAMRGRAVPTGLVFGTEAPAARGPMGEIEERVVQASGLRREDFLVPRMPELASRGHRRPLAVAPHELSHTAQEHAVRFRFRLPKGSYATCLLREYMKSDVAS